MPDLMDANHIININLLGKGYFKLNENEKKNLVSEEIKNYLVFKINELDSGLLSNDELNISDLISIISNLVDVNDYKTIAQLTHFIIGLMETLQGYSITWYINEDLEQPELTIENDIIKDLTTNTNYINSFDFIYDYFMNQFNEVKKTR